MPRKPAHEQFDTLKAIEDRAFELFGRYGYEGVSIGDIAKAARLSKGALYWHFQGKEELYLHCLKRLHGLFDHYIFEPMRAEPDALKSILRVFTGLRELLQDTRVQKGIAGYWLIPSTSGTSALTGTQRDFEAASVAALRVVLERASSQGQLDLGNDLDDMAPAMISLVEACALPLRHMDSGEVQRILSVLARSLFKAYAKSEDALALARLI